jgi:hypothetical protein
VTLAAFHVLQASIAGEEWVLKRKINVVDKIRKII